MFLLDIFKVRFWSRFDSRLFNYQYKHSQAINRPFYMFSSKHSFKIYFKDITQFSFQIYRYLKTFQSTCFSNKLSSPTFSGIPIYFYSHSQSRFYFFKILAFRFHTSTHIDFTIFEREFKIDK